MYGTNQPPQQQQHQFGGGGNQIASLQQSVGRQDFPNFNQVEMCVQVYPSKSNPQGFRWQQFPNGNTGCCQINGKLRKSWQGRGNTPGGVKVQKIRIDVMGPLGSWAMNNIRPGTMLYIKGTVNVSRFQVKNGPEAGQWKDNTAIQVRAGRDGDVTFQVLGDLPVIDETPPQHGQFNNMAGSVMPPQGGYALQAAALVIV